MFNPQKEAQVKLTKGLLDVIVLEMLKNEPMHGYQIITNIRRRFGVYLGPSTIYPMLGTLEEKKQVNSHWDMHGERPRKIYTLTPDGQSLLAFTESSLNLICKSISGPHSHEAVVAVQAPEASSGARKIFIST